MQITNKTASTDNRLRIILLGYIVRGPLGGLVWHHLQYAIGLARLGHDVYFVEDSGDYPMCYDPSRHTTDTDPSYGLDFARCAFDKVGLGEHWAYFDAHRSRWLGPCQDHILDVCKTADLVLNLSGLNPLRSWVKDIPVRVFIDTDPVFTQIRHITDRSAKQLALQHSNFFTFGERIGKENCNVPDDGLPWNATRQPVVLEAWPVVPGPVGGKYTTVMQWDSYPAREHEGIRYGMKSDSFGPYQNLPQIAEGSFEMALGGESAPQKLLCCNGWVLRNALETTRTPWSYRRYLRSSKAEFSVAKHGYVVSCSGWFSERSAAYLASGRPVIAQDTGFSHWLDTGSGVLAFNGPDEAIAAVNEVNGRYDFHCKAARAIAEAYFDGSQVLSRLIENAFSLSAGKERHAGLRSQSQFAESSHRPHNDCQSKPQ